MHCLFKKNTLEGPLTSTPKTLRQYHRELARHVKNCYIPIVCIWYLVFFRLQISSFKLFQSPVWSWITCLKLNLPVVNWHKCLWSSSLSLIGTWRLQQIFPMLYPLVWHGTGVYFGSCYQGGSYPNTHKLILNMFTAMII